MLLLVTLLLVIASAILLVVGFVQSALGFVYVSMVCAGVALLALIVFFRLARRRSMARIERPVRPSDKKPPTEAPAGDETPAAGHHDQAAAPVEPRFGEGHEWPNPGEADPGEEVVFPIEDYDRLRVSEILPRLSQLEPDELQEVRDRELAGKARSSVLDRIDGLAGRRQ